MTGGISAVYCHHVSAPCAQTTSGLRRQRSSKSHLLGSRAVSAPWRLDGAGVRNVRPTPPNGVQPIRPRSLEPAHGRVVTKRKVVASLPVHQTEDTVANDGPYV